MSRRMDIAFCVNDRYAEYIGVTVRSVCETQSGTEVMIHVLSDSLTDKSRRRLEEIVAPFHDVRLVFYLVDDSALRGLKDTWSIYTWYRVLLPGMLPAEVHRVLYLDTDTLVTGSLSELFSMDMTDKAIACAIDIMAFDDEAYIRCRFPREKIYVCAGVMLMNLDYWRVNDLSDKIIKYGRENDAMIRFPDQDTINILCQDTKIVLPMKYGIQEGFFRDERLYASLWRRQILECVDDPKIVHYAGCAPWIKELDWTVMHHRWMECSRRLRRPVFPKFQTRGLNRLKVWMYRMIHPDPRKKLTEDIVRTKLMASDDKC